MTRNKSRAKHRTAELQALHAALGEVDDPATELTLGRACADVARCVHLLRAAGHHVGEDALAEHDRAFETFLGRTLGGDLPQRSLDQDRSFAASPRSS